MVKPSSRRGPGGDRYGSDVLATDWRTPPRGRSVEQPADAGLVVEDVSSGFCGEIMAVENGLVVLEDRHGNRRAFRLGAGFWLDGKPVTLTRPARKPTDGPARTASGSIAVADRKARVALPSRIFVEGRHDAELIEKIWGEDLRVEGVAVEFLGGVDELPDIVRDFAPSPKRRLGVLVDHLVTGSKESRLAGKAAASPHVLIVGHPYIDIWQAVKPTRLGLDAWPQVPRDVEFKVGICQALGWPHADQADIARAWKRILGAVDGYADLEPALLGRVEELIDFVTAAPS